METRDFYPAYLSASGALHFALGALGLYAETGDLPQARVRELVAELEKQRDQARTIFERCNRGEQVDLREV